MSTDSLWTMLIEMRKDIAQLHKSTNPTVPGNAIELAGGSERLHVMVFKQKDEEIAQLKASIQQLQKINEISNIDQTHMKETIKSQTALINALQEGFEANSKLYAKSETDLAASLAIIEKMKLETGGEANETLNEMRLQVDSLFRHKEVYSLFLFILISSGKNLLKEEERHKSIYRPTKQLVSLQRDIRTCVTFLLLNGFRLI